MRYLKGIASLRYDSDRCTGCGRCVEVCPHRVFAEDGKKVRITDKDLCMECGACRMNCAFGAISVDSGVGCASAMITGMLKGSEPVCGCSDDPSNCC